MTSTERPTLLAMVEAALNNRKPDPKKTIVSLHFPLADFGKRVYLAMALRLMEQVERMGVIISLVWAWKQASPFDKAEIVACLGDYASSHIGQSLEAAIHTGIYHNHDHFLYV